MQGFQITLMTEQSRRIERQTATEWLLREAKDLGITGATVTIASESVGTDGVRHSARFFELTDQPVEVVFAVTAAQADALFERIAAAPVRLFYIKTPIEFGSVGSDP
jgi:PII-like signaling protein